MNFIYRIYQVTQDNEINEHNFNRRIDIILNQEVMVTESRETFKENIRLLYPEVKFANNGKLKDGDIYCIIISDTCYNTEEHIIVKDYECSHCGKIFKSNEKLLLKYRGTYEFKSKTIINEVLRENEAKIKDMHFCSNSCLMEHKNDVIEMLEEETLIKNGHDKDAPPDVFITKESFDNYADDGSSIGGYIYKISKRSTKEFYVGKTSYVPIYRWGQHLLTERFDIKNIDDYIFEILEIVIDKKMLNYREAHWINKCRDENPELSLNILIPKEK